MSVGMFKLSDEEIALQEVIRKFAQEEIKPHVLEMDRAPTGQDVQDTTCQGPA